jgi:hypothetical protein
MTVTVRRVALLITAVLAAAAAVVADADSAPFDLAGPNLEVTVTRGAQTLPVSEVPNLAAGGRLWIKADLPSTQSAHYLMVAAFLSGSTNPPPPNWFFLCETWARPCAQEGLTVTVPQDAQQVLVFLAPETRGDFRTLVDAVRGRPGAFVRASQDLNQATLDRSRLQAYLTAIHTLNEAEPARLREVAPLLARSLAIKVNEKCLDRIPELQAPCLMTGQESLILDDGHSNSIVEALTSGPVNDLAMQASYTPQLSYGYYSPYIASMLDIARILDSFHTAQYQYIPALASQQQDRLSLTLNMPPSFHNPKSVLVTALPAVEQAQLPPLHAVDPKEIYCARERSLVLPVEGAPLVFSTRYTRDVTLSLTGKDGKRIDLPAKADAVQGGYVVDTANLGSASLGDSVRGALHGYWGFDAYDGPSFQLVNAHAQTWQVSAADEGTLIVGRENTVHLQAGSVSCIDSIMLKDPAGKELKADWKTVKPDQVELKLPLQAAQPGAMTLLVTQYGASEPQPIELRAFAEPGQLDGFTIHAGDTRGILKGSRLDEVASVSMKGIQFVPEKLSTSQGTDELSLAAGDEQSAAALKAGVTAKAKVTLKDGRVFSLTTSVQAPRPSVRLIAKSVQPSASSSDSNIQLANQDELPQDATLIFSVRAHSPSVFAHGETIEVATADESFTTTLNLGNGGITLENAAIAVATLDPTKAFGPSAAGPLQFRVTAGGVAGDWKPLATLVRLPVLRDLKCPATPELACKLSGSNLFLLDSLSIDPQFEHPVRVPDGFPGYALPVPQPADGRLYVKLRDDPSVVNSAALGVEQLPPSPDEVVRAASRLAATQAAIQQPVSSGGGQPLALSSTEISPAPETSAASGAAMQLPQQQQPLPAPPQQQAVSSGANQPLASSSAETPPAPETPAASSAATQLQQQQQPPPAPRQQQAAPAPNTQSGGATIDATSQPSLPASGDGQMGKGP